VRVDVDEARRHSQALGVDLLAPGAGNAADAGDAAILHGDIGLARLAAAAVDHRAVAHHQVKLSGHGVPHLRGNASATSRGAHIVTIIVDTPTKLTKEQQTILQQFATTGGKKPFWKK